MKRAVSRVLAVSVMALALCSLGAESSGCWPGSTGSKKNTQSDQDANEPWCHNDPPIFCAAFCAGVDKVQFTDACSELGAHTLEKQFEDKVEADFNALYDQGVQVCPQADLTKFVTPCDVGITPKEWPDQDHEVCKPVPPGCPMSL